MKLIVSLMFFTGMLLLSTAAFAFSDNDILPDPLSPTPPQTLLATNLSAQGFCATTSITATWQRSDIGSIHPNNVMDRVLICSSPTCDHVATSMMQANVWHGQEPQAEFRSTSLAQLERGREYYLRVRTEHYIDFDYVDFLSQWEPASQPLAVTIPPQPIGDVVGDDCLVTLSD